MSEAVAQVLVLHGRKSADAAPVRREFALVVPNRRIVVQQIIATSTKLAEPGGDEHQLRLAAAALVLCGDGLAKAMQGETGQSFATCGFSVLHFGGEAYEWLSASRSIADAEVYSQGTVAIRACFNARNEWYALQEATDAARKASAGTTPPPAGTAEGSP